MDHRPPHPQPGNDFFFQNGAHHGHDGWWYGPLHLLFLLLVIALIVAAAVWLVRRLSPGLAQTTAPAAAPAGAVAASATADPAVTTLRMRYAKGEVSREDFQNALADLTGAEPPTGAWPAGADAGDEPAPTP